MVRNTRGRVNIPGSRNAQKEKPNCGPVVYTSLFIRSGKTEVVEEDPEKPGTLTELFQEMPQEECLPTKKPSFWRRLFSFFRRKK